MPVIKVTTTTIHHEEEEPNNSQTKDIYIKKEDLKVLHPCVIIIIMDIKPL